jgi:hypothetical protein
MTTTYQKLLNKIEAFCNAHLQIKKYKGEFKEQMPNFATLDEKYPIVFVVPNGDTEGLELNQFTLEVYCLDIIQKDRANINTIVSDCHLILKDLYLYFKDGTDFEVDVIGDPTMTPLNNDLLDYAAGWVMTITFEVEGYTVCAIPMNPIPHFVPTCEDATVENSNESYTATVASGGTLVLPDITVTDSDGSTFTQPAVTNVVCTFNPSCDDATYSITDDSLNVLYSGSIPSGGNLDQVIQDSTVTIRDGLNVLLHTVSVNAEGTANQVIGDTIVTLNKSNGDNISLSYVAAEGSITLVAPDTSIEVNGVAEGSVVAGSTVDIQLSDSLGVVTPLSVTQTGNDYAVVLPTTVCPPAVPRSTATLMKTGQTTSYRTGDDGDIEAGRDTDFFTLDAAPLHNDGSATLNTTTARFTDTLGGSTYANDWVLDWSTWNGSTILGYYKVAQAAATWNNAIDGALGTFGGFSGCRLPNVTELNNAVDHNLTNGFNYAPFSFTAASVPSLWTSTTTAPSTSSALYFLQSQGTFPRLLKTSTSVYIPVRTFSLSTSNVLS